MQSHAYSAAEKPGHRITIEAPTGPIAQAAHQQPSPRQMAAMHDEHDHQRFAGQQMRPQCGRHAEVVHLQHHRRGQQHHVDRGDGPHRIGGIEPIKGDLRARQQPHSRQHAHPGARPQTRKGGVTGLVVPLTAQILGQQHPQADGQDAEQNSQTLLHLLRQAKGPRSRIGGVRGQIQARHRHADAQQELAHDGQCHLVQTGPRRAVAVIHGAPLKGPSGSCAKQLGSGAKGEGVKKLKLAASPSARRHRPGH